MKNSKLKLFLLGAALLLSVGAAAVFYESNKEQTITLGIYVDSSWNVPNSEGTKVIDYAIRRFEKENRGVKIKYESGLEKNDYMDWLSEKIVANKSPDVFIVPSRQFNMLSGDEFVTTVLSEARNAVQEFKMEVGDDEEDDI